MKILRFTASWCVPCKQLAKSIEAAKLDIPVEVIDIDEHSQMVDLYGIRGVPTLVIEETPPITNAQGSSYPRLVGEKTTKEILEWVSENT